MSSWVFIVVRNNVVEQTRLFADFWVGCAFTDNFIRSIDKSMTDKTMPAYNRGEFYKKDDLSVGLYKV
jgi:lipopolysaccharide biosynthesis protein